MCWLVGCGLVLLVWWSGGQNRFLSPLLVVLLLGDLNKSTEANRAFAEIKQTNIRLHSDSPDAHEVTSKEQKGHAFFYFICSPHVCLCAIPSVYCFRSMRGAKQNDKTLTPSSHMKEERKSKEERVQLQRDVNTVARYHWRTSYINQLQLTVPRGKQDIKEFNMFNR